MCFRPQTNKTYKQLEDPFKARFLTPEWYTPDIFNAITFPVTQVVTNELMTEIHNTKKRIPGILNSDNEPDWLGGGELAMQNDLLQAVSSEQNFF